MIGYEEIPEDRLVVVTIDGRLTQADLRRCLERFESFVGTHKPVRILQIVRSISGIEPAALWQDLTFSYRHLDSFSRAAVVTDLPWVEWSARFAQPFVKAELRHFPLDELDAAHDWLLRPEGGPPAAA
jgi:hypothetical protein